MKNKFLCKGKPEFKIKRLKEGLVIYELVDNKYVRIK